MTIAKHVQDGIDNRTRREQVVDTLMRKAHEIRAKELQKLAGTVSNFDLDDLPVAAICRLLENQR